MDAYEAIMTRRSVPKLSERPVPSKEEIQKLLDAAVRAPTHHLTQPWRFKVLAGNALDELGVAWAAGTEAQGKDPSGVAAKTRRAPVIICVIERPHLDNPRCVEIEEHMATGMAMQNILLAAHAMGLGAMIRTGPCATLDEVRRYLGVEDEELIAGLIYVGYPLADSERPMTRRASAEERTEWLGW